MHALARHHEHAHKGMSGSPELYRFSIEGVEWTYRLLSKAPPAHTRPLCRLPLPNCPQHVAQLDVHATHFSECFSVFSHHTAHLVSAVRIPTRYPPRSRRYSPSTYSAIARSPPWARGYHNHRSPVPAASAEQRHCRRMHDSVEKAQMHFAGIRPRGRAGQRSSVQFAWM